MSSFIKQLNEGKPVESKEQYQTPDAMGEIADPFALKMAVAKYVRSRRELEQAMQDHQSAKEELLNMMPDRPFVCESEWKTYLVDCDPFFVRELEKI